MSMCAVPGCKNHMLHLFKFPEDLQQQQQWLQLCQRVKPINLKTARICSEHFEPSEILKDPSGKMGTLKEGAMPSLKLPIPQVLLGMVSPRGFEMSPEFGVEAILDVSRKGDIDSVEGSSPSVKRQKLSENLLEFSKGGGEVEDVENLELTPIENISSEDLESHLKNDEIPEDPSFLARPSTSSEISEKSLQNKIQSSSDHSDTQNDKDPEVVYVDDSPNSNISTFNNKPFQNSGTTLDHSSLWKPHPLQPTPPPQAPPVNMFFLLPNTTPFALPYPDQTGTIQELRSKIVKLEEQLNETKALLAYETNERNVLIAKEVEQRMRSSLSRFFTPGQVKSIISGKQTVHWTQKDIDAAWKLKDVCSSAYAYLRDELKYPLPSKQTLKRWRTKPIDVDKVEGEGGLSSKEEDSEMD